MFNMQVPSPVKYRQISRAKPAEQDTIESQKHRTYIASKQKTQHALPSRAHILQSALSLSTRLAATSKPSTSDTKTNMKNTSTGAQSSYRSPLLLPKKGKENHKEVPIESVTASSTNYPQTLTSVISRYAQQKGSPLARKSSRVTIFSLLISSHVELLTHQIRYKSLYTGSRRNEKWRAFPGKKLNRIAEPETWRSKSYLNYL